MYSRSRSMLSQLLTLAAFIHRRFVHRYVCFVIVADDSAADSTKNRCVSAPLTVVFLTFRAQQMLRGFGKPCLANVKIVLA